MQKHKDVNGDLFSLFFTKNTYVIQKYVPFIKKIIKQFKQYKSIWNKKLNIFDTPPIPMLLPEITIKNTCLSF